ncbi:hypothetical protein GGR58DRAFT_500818 [Xylaria digitata]|nr:hypothetical protein GGR58DRAFT_500818 [Xylaria digitata]
MSGTLDAFEITIEEAATALFNVAFDGAKYACLVAAITASLASLRGQAITDSILEVCPVTVRDGQKVYDFYYDTQDEAILSGVDAARETISSLCQQDTRPIPHSEMDDVLRHIAWTAATTVVQHIFYEDVTRSQTIIRIVDALRIGLRTGLDSGDPFNHSMAALSAALTAVLTASRSAIRLQSQPPGDSQSQSRPCIAEAESEATKAGVRAGKSALPPEFSS